jgi:glycosyltransferase involved in cell wall biosynthesis
MHHIARDQQRRGHRVTAVIGGLGGGLEARLRADGIPIEVFDFSVLKTKHLHRVARNLLDLVVLLRHLRPDVVHSHLLPSILMSRVAGWLADVPLRFSMIPGPYYLAVPGMRDIDVWTTRFDSKVIATCERTRTLYAQLGLPPGRVELMYYGQDTALFNPGTADGARVRRELGIAPDRPVVGDVAYFYPRLPDDTFTPANLVGRDAKGHDVLLRAFVDVLTRVPDAVLVLVGGGWGPGGPEYLAEMQERARSLGIGPAVRFTGSRADIPDVLMSFDISIQCSLDENLGGSIESQLMARPMIVSNVGGLPDAVKHERTGLLVPPGDAGALGEAIVRLLTDRPLAARLGAAGRAHALEWFTLDRTVSDIDALYRQELAATGGRGYRLWLMPVRAALFGVWAPIKLLAPMKRAIRRGTPRLSRVAYIGGPPADAAQLAAMAVRMKALGYEPTAMLGWLDQPAARVLSGAGIPCYGVRLAPRPEWTRWRRLLWGATLPLRVLRLARGLHRRVAAVHSYAGGSIPVGRIVGWLARVPCRVSTVSAPPGPGAPLANWIDRLTVRLEHRVIVTSDATRRHYEARGLTAPRLQCIPRGVDPAGFDPAAGDRHRARAALGIPAGVPLVGMVVDHGDDVLAAARGILNRHPATRFVLAGAAPAERHQQRLIAEARAQLSEAVVCCQRDDLVSLLAAIDVVVQGSPADDYGVTIEALLMERPTVAVRAGGLPDTVRDGATGLLVPPGDAAALASAVCHLLENPGDGRRFGEAGRRLMLDEFHVDRMMARVARLYEDLYAQRGLPRPQAVTARGLYV